MIFYNKDLFKKAGLDADNPKLSTYAEFLATGKKIVDSKAAPYAICPAPTSEFFQSWFDFFPLYAAETGGKQIVEDGKATFADAGGQGGRELLGEDVRGRLAPQEKYHGDSFADKKAAMAIVGPWAIAVYKGKVNWGVVPGADQGRHGRRPRSTPSATPRTSAMYTACKNQGTAWDVLKFATSEEQDGKLLDTTGQMPLRKDLPTTYADYFSQEPGVQDVRRPGRAHRRGARTCPNTVEIWQTIRDAYSKSVIFGKSPVDDGASRRRPTRSPSSPGRRERPCSTSGQPREQSSASSRWGSAVRGAVPDLPGADLRLPVGLAVWIASTTTSSPRPA